MKKYSHLQIMILAALLLVTFEMQKLPKPKPSYLKIRQTKPEKEDFLDEYEKVVDDAMKNAEDDIR